jgi:hypothetical protein
MLSTCLRCVRSNMPLQADRGNWFLARARSGRVVVPVRAAAERRSAMSPYMYTAKRYTCSYTSGQSTLIITTDQPDVEESLHVRVRERVRVRGRGRTAGRHGADMLVGLIGSNKPLHWTAEYRAVQAGLPFALFSGGASNGGQSSAASERPRSTE